MSLREQFNAKQSRKRKRTTAEPTQVEKDAVRHFSTFSHLIRMHSLLYTSVAAGVDEIVTKAYEGDVPPRGHRWAKQKISGNCRTYKNDTLASMEEYVRRLSYRNEISNSDEDYLRLYFEQRYTINNFMEIWRHMEGVIDLPRSSDIGQSFCKKIWIELAIKTRIYLDRISAQADYTTERAELVNFWDEMLFLSEFREQGVDHTCFAAPVKPRTFRERAPQPRLKKHTAGPSKRLKITHEFDEGNIGVVYLRPVEVHL